MALNKNGKPLKVLRFIAEGEQRSRTDIKRFLAQLCETKAQMATSFNDLQQRGFIKVVIVLTPEGEEALKRSQP